MRWFIGVFGLCVACGAAEGVGRLADDPCAFVGTPYRGPLAAEAALLDDPTALAWLHVREARGTGDAGFYGMAARAAACAVARTPGDPGARRAHAHTLLQLHRFDEAATVAAGLAASEGGWMDWMLVSDAAVEVGRLDEAAAALDRAMALRPGLPLYDRAAWLVWLSGDLGRALEVEQQAVQAGTPADPEPLAWALTRLGMYADQAGTPSSALDDALRLMPNYPPALLARGRARLVAGDAAGARTDLGPLQATVRGRVAMAELDASVDVAAVAAQDRRSFAAWLIERDPARAASLLAEELTERQDALTHALHAAAVWRAGGEGAAEATAALAATPGDPEVWFWAGRVLGRADLLGRALGAGAALLPSQRAVAAAASPPIPWAPTAPAPVAAAPDAWFYAD
jgi:tetratricopeptide (TPR) repeat protein